VVEEVVKETVRRRGEEVFEETLDEVVRRRKTVQKVRTFRYDKRSSNKGVERSGSRK
jgi:hypothetical protein